MSNRAILWSAAVLVTLGAGLAIALLILFGRGQNTGQLEAIKTAGTIVIGTGGAAALWLAARRQRTAEIALNQKQFDQDANDRAFALQERIAAASAADAEARRAIEQYGRAVEQLGSEKPAVRLGGIYALERLAQDNPAHRQTVVNVLCAYLRIPFDPEPPPHDRIDKTADESEAPAQPLADHDHTQEREVRLAIQQVFSQHFYAGTDPDRPPPDTFWPDTELRLQNAVLFRFQAYACRIRRGVFENAIFIGPTTFNTTTFLEQAFFSGAKFAGRADFRQTTFDIASFYQASFDGETTFEDATFASTTYFEDVMFSGQTTFAKATFAEGEPSGVAQLRSNAATNEGASPPRPSSQSETRSMPSSGSGRRGRRAPK
ncbi:pentapeptide repeat-containing protein [Amycolatopsis thailandensis]|uniref:pentapeptide repeat-containing protein n=1 Tax=Amycolatopsis thailandensis TaxID=589330 RepID=UPI003647021A